MPSIELSVIIAARNAADTIGEQLEALVAQHWEGDWEIVVVDNASTDSTARVVERCQATCERLRLVTAASGRGAGFARNVGMSSAKGRGFAFCDADDVVRPGWVREMGNALREHDVVAGPIAVERLNEPWLHTAYYAAPPNRLETFADIFPFGATCNLGVTKSAIEVAGEFDESFTTGQDIELCLRLWAAGYEMAYVADAIVDYRYRPTLGALWKRSRQYGAVAPAIARRLDELGFPSPGRALGAKNWIWLIRRLPTIRTRAGRARWVVVAGTRVGRVAGSLRSRRLLL